LGFTLLELILVMIIICTMLAVAAPNLRGFFSSRQLNNIADQMSVLCRYAKDQAVNESVTYRFNIDIMENEYWLSVLDQSQYRMLKGRFGEKFIIPEDVELTFDNVDQDGSCYYLDFTADGYGRQCTIQFEDKANTIALYSRGPCDNFEIIELYDDEGI